MSAEAPDPTGNEAHPAADAQHATAEPRPDATAASGAGAASAPGPEPDKVDAALKVADVRVIVHPLAYLPAARASRRGARRR